MRKILLILISLLVLTMIAGNAWAGRFTAPLGATPGGAGSDTTAFHSNIAGEIVVVTEKTAVVGNDEIIIEDSEATNAKKSVKVSNLPVSTAATSAFEPIDAAIVKSDEAETITQPWDWDGNYATSLQNISDLAASGPSYWFDGTDDVVTVSDNTAFQNIFSSGGSVIALVYPKSDGEGDAGRVFDKGVANIQLSNESAGYVRLRFIRNWSGDNGNWPATLTNVPVNAWSYIGVTYDASLAANDPLLYLSGTSLAITDDLPTGTADTDAGTDLTVSRGGNAFDGMIARLLQFNLALTATEVKALSSGAPIPYKYVGASQTETTSGTLVIGKAYRINDWITADDFANVGGANVDGTEFVATGTTPTAWAASSTVVRIGCVLDLNPSGIGTAQWLDASGNNLNGTASGALPVNVPPQHRDFRSYAFTTGETQTTLTEEIIKNYKYITDQGGAAETDLILTAYSYYTDNTLIDTEGNGFEICPPSGEAIYLDGTAIAADDCVDSTGAVGAKAVLSRQQIADASYVYFLTTVIGTWADGNDTGD